MNSLESYCKLMSIAELTELLSWKSVEGKTFLRGWRVE